MNEKESSIRIASQTFPSFNYIQDRPIAVSASRTEQIVVVSFAVWISIALEEVSRAELLIAVIARKVLRMPCLAECSDHLTDNRLIACIAAAFLHRIDSLS